MVVPPSPLRSKNRIFGSCTVFVFNVEFLSVFNSVYYVLVKPKRFFTLKSLRPYARTRARMA
jgi:hypothetical protein